jgi:hypothetical protein
MATTSIYCRTNGQIVSGTTDPTDAEFYRQAILVHTFKDVFGHVVAAEDSLLTTAGEIFYSSSSASEPECARDYHMGSSDGCNGCWSPDPASAIGEYVGVRFASPVTVTGFRFASGVYSGAHCPYGDGPCAYPTAFTLEASNNETDWTTLLSITDFTGMRVATQSLFDGEGSSWWDGGTSLSDRLDVANDHAYLAYRMVITAFSPDEKGRYNISELIFYGTAA